MPQFPDSTHRLGLILWLLFVTSIGAIAVAKIPAGFNFRSDLLALLPPVQQQPRVAAASARITKGFEQQLVFAAQFAGELTVNTLSQRAVEMQALLDEARLFSTETPGLSQHNADNTWQRARYQLLTNATRLQITDDADAVIDGAINALYGLMASAQPVDLVADPLSLNSRYQSSFIPPSIELLTPTTILAGTLEHPALLQLRQLNSGAFDLQKNDALLELIESVKNWGASHGAEIRVSGLPVFAAHGARRAQFEISTFGSISLIGVIGVLVGTFRSVRPLLGTLGCIGVGIGTAMVITQAIFDEIHLLTLVFGASLIGISVDYALHYLCDALGRDPKDGKWTPSQSLKSVLPGITIALATSVAAFLSFLFTPFPGLQQIAVFSASGLVAAWLTVITLLPGSSAQPHVPALRYMAMWNQHWPFMNRRLMVVICLLTSVVIITGLLKLTPDDNVRILQSSPPSLLADDAEVRRLSPYKQASQFFVVSADSPTALLAAESRLIDQLDTSAGHTGAVTALSTLYPSATQQRNDYALIKSRFYDSGRMRDFYQALGVTDTVVETNARQFDTALSILSIDDWLIQAPQRLQTLWLGCDEIDCRSIVLLHQVLDKALLAAIAEQDSRLSWVDRVGDISELLHRYRLQATQALLIVYGLAVLLLIYRFGLAGGLRVAAVPIIATAMALAVTGLVGNIFSLFSLLALMVVAGISIDYAVFYRLHGSNRPSTSLAIALSAATTMLAFGLLSMSDTAVVHTFGLTLMVGILTAFLISPLAAGQSQENHN